MIPKTIHYCWFGHGPKPELAKKCIRSWKKYCSDYNIVEWNEENYDVTKIPYMKAAYDAQKWAFVSDYARLDIIFQYGGIYLDTDVEVLKSYDSLLGYSGFAGFEDGAGKKVATGLGFGAEAESRVIRRLMKTYESMEPTKEDGAPNFITCPVLDTEALISFGLRPDGSLQIIDDNFLILPSDYLCPKSFGDGVIRKTKNTISIHHFTASWFSSNRQEEKVSRWKREKRNYYRYMPNRVLLKILGVDRYNRIRSILKRK